MRIRVVAIASALALTAAAAGACGGTDSTESSGQSGGAAKAQSGPGIDVPDYIKSKGTLDVGTAASYPPFYWTENGETKGTDAHVVMAVARKLGVKARFHEQAVETLLPSVVGKRTDVVIGGMGDLPERRKAVNFVDLWRNGINAVVRKGNPTHVDPLNLCGHTFSVTQGAIAATVLKRPQADCKKRGKPPLKIVAVKEFPQEILSLKAGRTEGLTITPAVAGYLASKDPELEILPKPIPAFGEILLGFAYNKQRPELGRAMATAMEQLSADGTLDRILKTDYGDLGGKYLTPVQPPLINTKPVPGS